MTDQTIPFSAIAAGLDHAAPRQPAVTRFFQGRRPSALRALAADFRAVPVEAWIILAVATVLSNLFIALA